MVMWMIHQKLSNDLCCDGFGWVIVTLHVRCKIINDGVLK